ncbi:ParB/Srx family N-terminal domain-containing protein [Bradyrhizobium diazoefficiens]|uniref:ParB/Srx family N-terminal domain-containing protein n=1 Tax=Bradyrhizobium diazoefficiens TaxID=1355477 RepID=UPI00272D6AAF|nr:ParB/Srx family N-terminal domain-containing protein [Bradyrhizobium diazoefficiens]WLA75057.1 ParB/Srx family N-terminal domain-containing protein [Bradyrhizobium diazoefficiens]
MDALIDKAAVEVWPIGRLRPYERNSRRHSPEQIQQIAASIREWGWTMPILAADDGMVLAGHGRLAAGKLLGIAEVPVIVARGWSENQKRAYVIADNRLTDASDWDDEILRLELNDLLAGGFELLLTGITEDELTKLSVGVAALEAMPELPNGERSPYRDMTFILYGEQWGTVDAAIKAAIKPRDPNSPNRSPQGNALADICAEYLLNHAQR